MECPKEFLERMQTLLGEEYSDFIKAMEGARSYGLRINPLKQGDTALHLEEIFALRPIPWAAGGFYYDPETRPGRHPYYEAGLYYIQEPSAMAVGALAAPEPGMRVLDLCAAPGGKTTHLAGYLKGEGLLVANEIHPGRAKILAQSVERAGIINCLVTNEPPDRLAERFPQYFDCIVVDAPCSGEGMFRKEEIAVTEWTPDAPTKCAERQAEILDSAAKMLKPGGKIVYSTCTFAPEEDEGSVQRFLEHYPAFSVRAELQSFSARRPEWPGGGSPELSRTCRLFPHKLSGEGHFAAVLQHHGIEEAVSEPPRAKALREKEIPEEYRAFERDTLTKTFPHLLRGGDILWSLPEDMPDASGLRVLRQGLQLGTVKKGRFEPSHALALALDAGAVQRVCRLTAEQSIPYLCGQTIPCNGENGWTLVLVDGISLGWGKVSGGVLKNHYPKGLRWNGQTRRDSG